MARVGRREEPMLSRGTEWLTASHRLQPAGPPATSEMDETLVRAARETGAHIAMLYLLDAAGEVLLMQSQMGLPGPMVGQWSRLRAEAGVPATVAVRRRERVWVPDLEELARRFPAMAFLVPYHFSVLATPLRIDDRVVGSWVLMWSSSRQPRLGSYELEVIDEATRRMEEVLKESAGDDQRPPVTPQPRTLTPLPSRPSEGARTPAAFGFADRLRDGCVSLDLYGHITYLNDPAAEMLGGASHGTLLGRVLWDAVDWLRGPVFKERFRHAVVSQQPTTCLLGTPGGVTVEARLHPDPTGVSLHLVSTGKLPLADSSAHPQPHHLHELLHLAATLTRALTVRQVIEVVTDHMMAVCGVHSMAVFIAEGGRLRVLGSHGFSRTFVERLNGMPVDCLTMTGRVMRTGEARFYGDREEMGEVYKPALDADDMEAWAFLPLSLPDRLAGTCVVAFEQPHPFSGAERTTLTSLAGLMAQALDRALLYEAKDQAAHCLQTSLLPRRLPDIEDLEAAARYVPATRGVGVGGDFYDLIRLHDHAAVAVIGDVQGHNLSAAALMGQVRTAIHASATDPEADPGTVLRNANRLLLYLDTDLFTSCVLLHLDLRLRAFSIANAGHPPPLLRAPGGAAEPVEVPPGPLLGIDPDAEYPTLQVPFSPGAILALYTDGLIEAPGVHLDDAIARLAAYLTKAGQQPLHLLGETLLDQAPAAEQRGDDIALLLLEHLPRP
ncbi:SpoIIE family protein phosphatase [Nonomuraea sp. NPDC052634]|uniref:SpoIIE family protein phosphatase n=1 Tax=Nonomuraea sp. NPDC052634 TaxID=3155813 RepID=UPI003426946E